MRKWMDKILNWSGGSYVGLSTLTMLGMAVGEFHKHGRAPEWFVGSFGLYVVILGLFAAGKPLNQWLTDRNGKPKEE